MKKDRARSPKAELARRRSERYGRRSFEEKLLLQLVRGGGGIASESESGIVYESESDIASESQSMTSSHNSTHLTQLKPTHTTQRNPLNANNKLYEAHPHP